MEEESDLDLEDIEARLYSQIHHPNKKEEGDDDIVTELARSNLVNTGNRYFKEPNHNSQNKINPYSHFVSNQFITAAPNLAKVVRRQRQSENRPKNTKVNVPKRIEIAEEIVNLDDSDEDCIEIPHVISMVDLCSDVEEDEKKVELEVEEIKENNDAVDGDDDDVIFVENAVETIAVDIDEDSLSDVSSEEDGILDHDPTAAPKDARDTLSTPDSNDFLDNILETSRNNFNFSLHGSDFQHSSDKSKGHSSCGFYDSESSNSESLPSKTSPVFSEVPLDVLPRNIFEEDGLERFGNYITRKEALNLGSSSKEISTSASEGNEKTQDDKLSTATESSSESDYEDENVLDISKEIRLPNLSLTELNCDNTNPKVDTIDVPKEVNRIVENVEHVQEGVESPAEIVQVAEAEKEKGTKRSLEHSAAMEKRAKRSSLESSSVCVTVEDESKETFLKKTKNSEEMEKIPSLEDEDDSNQLPISFFNDGDSSSSDDLFVVDQTGITDLTLANVESVSNRHEKFQESLNKTHCFADYWTDDKKRFYWESWGNENFDVQEAQKGMSDDPDLWKIRDSDRYMYNRTRGRRCKSCKDFGHIKVNCPNRKPPSCILCGKKGHYESRCPDRMCVMCGQRAAVQTVYCRRCILIRQYTCRICKFAGHEEKQCPDLWRRYHSTTAEGPPAFIGGQQCKNRSEQWCSGCASKGHLEHECYYLSRTHPPTTPRVVRYDHVYNESKPSTSTPRSSSRSQDDSTRESPKISSATPVRKPVAQQTTNDVRTPRRDVNKLNFVPLNAQQTANEVIVESLGRKTTKFETMRNQPWESASSNLDAFARNRLVVFGDEPPGVLEPNPSDNFTYQRPVPVQYASPNVCLIGPMHRYFNPCVQVSTPFVTNLQIHNNVPGNYQNQITYFDPNDVDLENRVGTILQRIKKAGNYQGKKVGGHYLELLFARLRKLEKDLNRPDADLRLFKDLKDGYSYLHSVLFGYYQLQLGSKHLSTLRKMSVYLKQRNADDLVPGHLLREIEESYSYLYGGTRRQINYGSMIRSVKARISGSTKKQKFNKRFLDIYSSFRNFCSKDSSLVNTYQEMSDLLEMIKKRGVRKNDMKSITVMYAKFKNDIGIN